MANRKLFTVIGATGNQGGSVLRDLLAHPVLSKQFRLRGTTRDASKPAAKAWTEQGVEMVNMDLMDVESVKKAFEGSWGVFAVTNFWESVSKETEVAQGRNIADAAKAAGVELLVWSSLPPVKKISKGTLTHVLHFDGKAEVADYMKSLGLPVVVFYAGWFTANLTPDSPLGIQPDPNGVYTLASTVSPASKFPFYDAARDTGKFIIHIITHQEELLAAPRNVIGVSEWIGLADVMRIFEEVTGKKAQYVELGEDEFKMTLQALAPALHQEVLESMQWRIRYGYFGDGYHGEEGVRELNRLEGTMSVRRFLELEKTRW